MNPPELLDHAKRKENYAKPSQLNIIGVEAGTNVAMPRVEDGNSRMLKADDLERPEGTSFGGGTEYKNPKEDTGFHVVDVKINEEHLKAEKNCRICHLSNEPQSGSPELIQLGCNCREELGISHRFCAEKWFKQRGTRLCEICNRTAKNVRLIKDNNVNIIEIAEYDSQRDGSRWCKRFCDLFLACLVIAFIVSTFLKVKILQ